MKNLITLLTLFTILASCGGGGGGTATITPTVEDPKTAPLKLRKLGGDWLAAQGGSGGLNNFESFKNFQYSFEVGENNQAVDITVSSAQIDVQFALFDPNGKRLDVSSTSRTPTKSFKLNTGKHRLVVCAARQAVGKFEFTILGILGDPKRIESQVLQSNTQNWGPLGGGGRDVTFKNHFYTFDITDDNSSIDVELESADTDVYLMIYNELGEPMLSNSVSNNRYQFAILGQKKGTYRVMAATRNRKATGAYRLNIFGKVNNLKKIDSQTLQSNTQNWGKLGGGGLDKTFKNHFYIFDVTEDNSNIDVELESADTEIALTLYDALGQRIVYEWGKRNEFKVLLAKKGTYTVMAATRTRGNVGNYQVNIVGKVSNLKKLDSQANTVTGRWANRDAVDTYSFRVSSTGNSPVDMELSSADVNVNLELQNGSGNLISRMVSNKTEFIISKDLAPGTYRVQVKPYGNGFGNYTLHVHGQFADFKKL